MEAHELDEILEEIREASAPFYPPGKSPIDGLLTDGWVDAETLAEVRTHLEGLTAPSTAAFSQLPYPIHLPDRWLRLDKYDIEARFRLVGVGGNRLTADGRFDVGKRRRSRTDCEPLLNATIPADRTGGLLRTQVVTVRRLHGPWLELFNAASAEGAAPRATAKAPLRFRSGDLKQDGVPITVRNYRDHLASRARRNQLRFLSDLVPKYAAATGHGVPDPPSRLFHFFVMLPSGGITVKGTGPSMVGAAAEALVRPDVERCWSRLRKRLQTGREPSQYERLLVRAMDDAEHGRNGLAIVQAAMVLEWFANVMIEAHLLPLLEERLGAESPSSRIVVRRLWGERRYVEGRHQGGKGNRSRTSVSLSEKLTDYMEAAGVHLPPKLASQVKKLVQTRNAIVHQDPSADPGRAEAVTAVETALEYVDHVLREVTRRTVEP